MVQLYCAACRVLPLHVKAFWTLPRHWSISRAVPNSLFVLCFALFRSDHIVRPRFVLRGHARTETSVIIDTFIGVTLTSTKFQQSRPPTYVRCTYSLNIRVVQVSPHLCRGDTSDNPQIAPKSPGLVNYNNEKGPITSYQVLAFLLRMSDALQRTIDNQIGLGKQLHTRRKRHCMPS